MAEPNREVVPPTGGLLRMRLLDPVLDRHGARLVVVSAPAGAGKTTLLRQVEALSAVPAIRYQAVEDDDEAALVARLGRAATARLRVPASGARTAVELGAALRAADPGLLVMDDLHELGEDAARAVERLVLRLPDGWRAVLGCRRPVLADLPVLRVGLDVREIDGDDLRFRSWEVEKLFGAVYGSPLPPESVAALTRRTAGWAAGLALFHLATTRSTPAGRRRAVDELAGGSRLLRSYLTRSVLDGLPERRRVFLTRTCALGVLTGPLCDELLGTTHSRHVLEELAHEQLFTSTDDDGLTFRYHHVLQSHLEVSLVEQLGTAGARRWYTRCAALLESAGHLREALRAHARAEDWASMGRLLQQGPVPAGVWQDLVPAARRRRDPWFVRADARRRLREGDLDGAARGLREAAELSDEPVFQQQCRQERAAVEAWLRPHPTGGGTAGGAADVMRDAVRFAPDASVSAGVPPRSSGEGLVAGLALLLAGRPGDAAAMFEHPFPDDPTDPTDPGILLALDLGLLLARLLTTGVRPETVDRLEATVLAAETDDHPWLARLGRALLAAATGSDAGRELDECERRGDRWGAALVQLVSGAGALLNGGPSVDAVVQARLDDAAGRFHALDAAVVELWARCAHVVVLSRIGAPGAPDAGRAALEVELRARRLRVPAAGLVARIAAARSTRSTGTARRAPSLAALTCLGGFGLRAGAVEVDLDDVRPRARTLLRYLAVHLGTGVHRERLADALWPGVALAASTRSLQVAVSSLRGALDRAGLDGAAMLRRDAEAYRLALPEGGTADVVDLRRGVSDGDAAEAGGDRRAAARARRTALARYAGELLPEDGPAEWVVTERERLRLLAARAAVALADDHRVLGDLTAAVAAAQRAVELDPWSDPGWRLLIALHDRLGDRGAAARCRARYDSLTRELDTGLLPVATGQPTTTSTSWRT